MYDTNNASELLRKIQRTIKSFHTEAVNFEKYLVYYSSFYVDLEPLEEWNIKWAFVIWSS